MKVGRAVALAAVCLLSTACFHQVVQTGRPAGTTTVLKPWVSTWVFGLVAAQPIDVSKTCTSGVATVETRMSFLNGLVGGLTLGIWSPQEVKVTCAGRAALNGGLREFHVAAGASQSERDAVFTAAAQESERTSQPVVVRF